MQRCILLKKLIYPINFSIQPNLDIEMAIKYLHQNEYKEWLISIKHISKESAASYVSYMSSLLNSIQLNDQNIADQISEYYVNEQYSLIDSILSNALETLHLEDICEIVDRPKNTINNWRSSLLQYREFICDKLEISPEENAEILDEPSDIKMLVSPEVEINSPEASQKYRFRTYRYTLKEIMANFGFRLTTQDRFFGEVFFPVSYVKRLLCNNGHSEDFNKWLGEQLKRIEILCDNGNSHTIGEISELKIRVSKDQSDVFITVNNTEKAVYTSVAFKNVTLPLRARNLKSIAIDHVNSMKNILAENSRNLPQLRNITLEFRKLAGETAKFKEYKTTGSILLDLPFSSQICLDSLMKELNLLNTHTKLRLMDKIENIKKSAN
jgi:hypothetical protein